MITGVMLLCYRLGSDHPTERETFFGRWVLDFKNFRLACRCYLFAVLNSGQQFSHGRLSQQLLSSWKKFPKMATTYSNVLR